MRWETTCLGYCGLGQAQELVDIVWDGEGDLFLLIFGWVCDARSTKIISDILWYQVNKL